MFYFHIFKNQLEELKNTFLHDIKNTSCYNAFYSVYSINNDYYDRIDINLTSKTFEALNEFYNENIEDKNAIIESVISILSETIQHEYLHKVMGYYINLNINRDNCDNIIERLINR